MIDEPFAAGNSPIHREDPRSRVILATLFSFVVALSQAFATLGAALIFALVLVIAARLDPKKLIKRLLPLWLFLILLWLVLPLTTTGTPLFRIGPLAGTREGIILCAQITLKSNAILLAFTAWVATMNFAKLGQTLDQLKVPEKIVYLLLLTYRYIFVIEAEYGRLLRAAKIRGFKPGTNLHTYKTYAYLLGMLFVQASARAQRVHQAMRCRGFQGKFYSLYRFEAKTADWIGAAVQLAIMALLIGIEWKINSPL